MSGYKAILNTRAKYLLGFISLCLISVFCAFHVDGNDNFDLARQELMFRKIGHEILLHSGDSTSRVLPVKKILENEYQVRFENEFTFQPDSLVSIVKRALAKDHLANNYVVNVLNCSGTEVIFGYAISGSEKNDIVPCKGRKQLKSCYVIDLKFQRSGITTTQKDYLLGSLPLLAFVGLLIFRPDRSGKNKTVSANTEDTDLKIGNTLFDIRKRHLAVDQSIIALTVKEAKLLLIFARSPNVIIERSRLQKEIWEDEGVIVGRSLDMFISKLRKKLENDHSVQLVNIHGKGYKLEIKS